VSFWVGCFAATIDGPLHERFGFWGERAAWTAFGLKHVFGNED